MYGLHGPPSLPPYAGVPGSNGSMPPSQPQSHCPNGMPYPSVPRRSVRMIKRLGEGSFGMTLDQNPNATAADFPRVSYVFPHSAAYRAGVCSGWTIESINGLDCRGRHVRDVAPVFRELQEVILNVDVRTETVTAAMPLLSSLGGNSNNYHAPSSGSMPQLPQPPQQSGPFVSRAVNTATVNPLPSSAAMMNGHSSGNTMHDTMLPSFSSPPSHLPTRQQLPVAVASAQSSGTAAATHPTASQSTPRSVNGVSPNRSSAAATASSKSTSATSSAPSASTTSPRTTVPTLVVAPKPSASMTVSSAPPRPVVAASIAIATALTPQTAHVATSASLPVPAPRTATAAAPATPPVTTRSPSAAPQPTTASARTPGKKRARSQSDQHVLASIATSTTATEAAAASPAPATGRKRARAPKRRQSAPLPVVAAPSVATETSEEGDVDYAAFCYYSVDEDTADEDDVEEVSAPPPSSRRTSSRQAESGGRARRSLTIARLITMGFDQEEADLSVQACGQDPVKCMLWISSYRDEKQFMEDLNKASIESENQKRLEAQEQKKQETETLRHATAFTSLFQTSYILSDDADAPRLKAMLASTIGEIAADTLMRTLMTKLLTVESKAIKWYKDACKCYMLELAARLETALGTHDVVTCCATLMVTQPATAACAFVQALHEEEQALTQALFFMPENQGGVPLAFLRADESMQFSLDDDGFEVVDQPPTVASPDHE